MDILINILNDILGQEKIKNLNKKQYAFNCPICSYEKDVEYDGKFNLEVSLEKNVCHCWSCQFSGSVGKLITQFGRKEHKKKLKQLGIQLNEIKGTPKVIQEVREIHLPEEFQLFETSNKNDLIYKEAWNYLTKERGLLPETIYKHKMGFVKIGEYSHRIILPSYDIDDKLNYFTARTWLKHRKPKYKNPDLPREEVIFNEKLVNWDSTIYIVEGPFDHIVVYNSIPMLGKDLHPKLYDSLMKKANSWVVVLLDDDAWDRAKQIYTQLNIGRLHGKVKIIKMADGYDISQVNEEFGRQGVIDVLSSSFKIKESTI